MNPAQAVAVSFDRVQRMAILVAVLALGSCILAAFFDATQFFRSYLLAYLFCLGMALGSLGINLLHNVVGGRWGALIKRILNAGMATLPFMAILVLPVLAGIPTLYHWSHHEVVQADPVLQHKSGYLNVPFFIVRTVIYFIIWIGLAFLLKTRAGDGATHDQQSRGKVVSAPGLIIFVFTVTFAGVDWVMSLEPHWYSTMYGGILLVGQTLSAFCFSVIILWWLSDREPFAGLLKPEHYHDLGNLIFAFTVLWAYTSFSQFLIIWSGNIPEETPWYIRRTNNGWQVVSVVLIVFHFAVPFFILLSRYVKRRGRLLARVAAAIIFVRLVDLFYWIEPPFHQTTFGLHWMDIAAPLGLGGVWLWLFLFQLKRGPLVNLQDARLQVHGVHH
ncbi:MAG TPA: hypothetical protein VMZ52_03180 [Bryobacteraceae bacterium]|nr:hypothetical protein [Bryobacteraceae bacterium]